jgi:hypothetical protein
MIPHCFQTNIEVSVVNFQEWTSEFGELLDCRVEAPKKKRILLEMTAPPVFVLATGVQCFVCTYTSASCSSLSLVLRTPLASSSSSSSSSDGVVDRYVIIILFFKFLGVG